MSRVSFHQNIFDLLDGELPVSTEAVRMIERSEWVLGERLPASIREWYALAQVVPHVSLTTSRGPTAGSLLQRYSTAEHPASLDLVLAGFTETRHTEESSGLPCVLFLQASEMPLSWWLVRDGSDDPPVLAVHRGSHRTHEERIDPFSTFLFRWLAGAYLFRGETWRASGVTDVPACPWTGRPMRHTGGFWLRAPREPAVPPPLLDLLIDHLDEPERQMRPQGVQRCTFTAPHGRLHVTTDPWDATDGHSAWWLEADSAEGLYDLAWRVWSIGSLSRTLQGFSRVSREILERLRKVT